MTVIAYHHKTKTLACDSRTTTETGIYASCKKWERLESGAVVVAAGDYNSGREIIKYLKRQLVVPEELHKECVIVVLDSKGRCWAYDESSIGERIRTNYAWGSGEDFAFGAFHAGADAEGAVRAACKYNNTCGGKVHVFKME